MSNNNNQCQKIQQQKLEKAPEAAIETYEGDTDEYSFSRISDDEAPLVK